MVASRRLICFCAAAVFRQVPGCVFFTGTSVCRKMINGVSGTDASFNNSALIDPHQSDLIEDKNGLHSQIPTIL
jgi:hypothetical protein